MFDARPDAFGSFDVTGVLGRGRFGLVFRAQEASSRRQVVVRTFTTVAAESAPALAESLASLCEQPLDHPSVAQPIASGLKGNVPYLVHGYLEGTPLDLWIDDVGFVAPTDALLRLTHVAAALDFAAAVGVRHGLLSLRDVIVADERSGVTGFGLAQALATAGVPVGNVVDDIRALAAIASVMLGDPVRGPVADVIASARSHGGADTPGAALAFVARLQDAHDAESVAAPVAAAAIAVTAVAAPEFVAASPISEHRSYGTGFFAAVALAIGILAGFAAGLATARRDAGTPADRGDVVATQGYSEAPVQPPPSAVERPASEERPAPPSLPATPRPTPPEPSPAPPPVRRLQAAPAPPPAPVRSGPGSLNVVSRPAGAQVYVDERLIGSTPLSLPEVPPGAHTVRLALPGHQRWESHVIVSPGTRTRVAASLEQ